MSNPNFVPQIGMSDSVPLSDRLDQWSKWQFAAPQKHIDDLFNDLSLFEQSPGGKDVIGFILALNSSVQGLAKSAGLEAMGKESVFAEKICSMLGDFKMWISDIPPQVQEQRFGNKAFRTWMDRVAERIQEYLASVLLADCEGSVI